MADRYWVGGTASWDSVAGTKWSATSGGTGGASVPTTADDVFFDANSGAVTVTVAATVNARNLNFTGFTGTFSGPTNRAINIAGNVTLVSGMTMSGGSFVITAPCTFISAGKSINNVNINGATAYLTLGDAMNSTANACTVTRGTLDTNGYNFSASAGLESITTANTRSILFRSSTVNLASISLDSTNLTFNAGTSQLNITGNSGFISATGSFTFYNVTFTSVTLGTKSISGSHTFNNLTYNPTATNALSLVFDADQTVNGTFNCSGTSAIQRCFVRSNTIGTTRTLTCNAVTATDVDFRDITIAGSAAPLSGTRLGDCKGNSGITFPAPKTVYWVNTSTANWGATTSSWSLTSGGGQSQAAFPLAQDTVIFDSLRPSSGSIVTINAGYNIGTIDMSARTSNTMTLNISTSPIIYGNFISGSGVSTSVSTGTLTFSGRNTQTITSAGTGFNFNITVDSPSGTVQLADAFRISDSVRVFTLTQGTFDAVSYNVTAGQVSATGSLTKSIKMGSGLWTLSGIGTVWSIGFLSVGNVTFDKGTAEILLSNNTTNSRTFRTGGFSYNKVTIGGNTATNVTQLNSTIGDRNGSIAELASTKTVAHTVSLSAGFEGTTVGTWSITGSLGNVVTVSSNNAGTRNTFDISNTTSGIDYLAVQDVGITTANRFYVGANSTNNGNNTNVIFTAAPAPSASNSNFFLMFA